MTDSWRFPGPMADAPEWVQPFLALDAEWTEGRARGYTSGSTGEPKAIDFDPEAVIASARATAAHFGLEGSDRTLQAWSALPAAGIGGRMMWWRARILGWQLTQRRPIACPVVPERLDGDRFDFAVATPQQAEALARNRGLGAFRILLLGGGPVPPSLEDRLMDAGDAVGCELHHGFGMTETLTHVATRRLGTALYRALPGVEWTVGPDGGLVVEAPERGVHALHTRDAVEPGMEAASGLPGFRWLGRLDDVINTGGLKVHPADLERRIAPLVLPLMGKRRWYLAGRPHAITGQQVTLILEGEEDPTLGLSLLEQLAEGHPQPDRPRAVEWRERFEETATGKVRRR